MKHVSENSSEFSLAGARPGSLPNISCTFTSNRYIYLLTDNIDIKAIFEDTYQDSVLQVVRNCEHT